MIESYLCRLFISEAIWQTFLAKHTNAFHRLAARGRKLGLTPFLYTQSISEVTKTAIRQAGVKVLMRQTLDIDLNRYCEYIRGATDRTRKAIQAFPRGKAIVILPDGAQHSVQFYERVSAHPSHTPQTRAALTKFADASLDMEALAMRDLTASQSEPAARPRKGREPKQERTSVAKVKHAPAIRERIFTLLDLNPGYTSRQLAAIVGCPQNTAQIVRKAYFGSPPKRQSVEEQRIRNLLAENPNYTFSQLAHRANCAYKDAKRWVEHIQGQAASRTSKE